MLTVFQSKLSRLSVHLLLVWDLKQTIINPNNTKPAVNKMRNIHKLEHLPMYVSKWGSLNHLDTGTYESFHKIGTTGVWENTSKRHNTLFEEMTHKISMYDYQRLNKIKSDILTEELSENVQIDKVTFKRITNLPYYLLFIPYQSRNQIYVGKPGDDDSLDDKYWHKVCYQRVLDRREKLAAFLQKHNIHEVIETQYEVRFDNRFNQLYQMRIIPGISYRSDEESQMGTGTIYACSRHNVKDRSSEPDKPRYDYVFVKYEYMQEPVLVRILMIIEIIQHEDEVEVENEDMIVLLIQKLIKVPNSGSVLGDTYQFAADPANKTQFNYDIVPVQSIIRPAFVVPVFTLEPYSPISNRASDRFRVLDRMFFDRSGWQENESPLNELETAEQRDSYIKKHQTGNRILKNSTNNTVYGYDDDDDNDMSSICIDEEYDYSSNDDE
jgi:hypothetical protein